jgi:Fe-S cluster assembly protein SufD
MNAPLRLSPAEQTLIAQLNSVNAPAEADRLAGAGLPTRRVESYHYTDLKLLLRDVPELAGASATATASPLAVPGARRLTIVNGRPQPFADLPAGIRADTVPGSVLSQRDDVVVRLNAALVENALSLEISGEVGDILQIDRRIEGAAAHAASAAKVFVGDGASVTIVETYSGSDAGHVGNHATYMALGKNAVVTHVTVDLSPRQSTHFATNEYVLAEGARLRTLVIHAGAGLARTQLFPKFAGKGAHADVTGLNLVGDGQHADITMDASHAVPGTSSKPLFKSIARGRSKAVVQGRLIVARDAQKTDAKFMHQGLMLSDDAEILSKPELEIYADDVVCGHGSTCGQLNEDHLFYLMSRGISKGDAEVMLIRAFLAELVDPIEDEGLRAVLTGVIDGWLSSR